MVIQDGIVYPDENMSELIKKEDCVECKNNTTDLITRMDEKISKIKEDVATIKTNLAVYGEKIKNLEKIYYGLVGAVLMAVLLAVLEKVIIK